MKQVLVSEELLRQVIEVLEQADERDGVYSYRCEIDALRAALEKPAQKTCGRCVVFCQGGEGCHCNAPQISQRGRERLVSDQLNRRPAVEPTCKPPLQVHKPTGWVAHKDQYAVSVLFNPYTGEPRDVRDVQSDPQGILIVPPGKVEMLAAKPAPVQVSDKLGAAEWTPCMKLPVVVHVRHQRDGERHVSTREGITPIKPDDLIMRGVSGEEYPIGRAIFDQTYTFDIAAQPRKAVKLSAEEITEIAISHPPNVHIYARAIEAAVWAKMGVTECQ